MIGLPGDRIGLRDGRVWINGTPVGIRPAGSGEMETEDGGVVSAARFVETLPGGHEHPIYKVVAHGEYDNMSDIVATIVTIRPIAACRYERAAWGCCRSRIWSVA